MTFIVSYGIKVICDYLSSKQLGKPARVKPWFSNRVIDTCIIHHRRDNTPLFLEDLRRKFILFLYHRCLFGVYEHMKKKKMVKIDRDGYKIKIYD